MKNLKKNEIGPVKKLTALLLLLFIYPGCIADADEHAGVIRELTGTEKEFVASMRGFSFNIFQNIAENEPQKNIFISPFSIYSALGMVLNGAEGETAGEIQQALRQETLALQTANEANKSVAGLLTGMDSKVRFSTANSLWGNQRFGIKKSYEKTLSDYYDAHIQTLNFEDPGAKDIINDWVSKKTEKRIPKLLESTNPLEALLLINTIYFKGDWTHPFKEDQTEKRAFYPEQGEPVQTDMMYAGIPVEWYRGDEVIAANLHYGDELYHMTVLMPVSDETPIDTFISEQLSPEKLAAWADDMDEEVKADVFMPKFSIGYSLSLVDVLKSLGITAAFDERLADFSNISEDDDLLITRAFHSANITVDEKGTTASAATGIGLGTTSVPDIPVLNLNRPFVYLITEKNSGVVLFMGVMRNPELQ